jgi:protein phosphatase
MELAAEASPVQITAKSDPGLLRESNQDAYFDGPVPEGKERSHGRLLMIADGMGGHAAGEVASSLTCAVVSREYYAAELEPEDDPVPALRRAFQEANAAIIRHGGDHLEHFGMGTTCSAAILREGRFWICPVGDSRIFRGGRIECLTRDHTLVQQMIDRGQLSRDEAGKLSIRHILVRALGIDENLAVDQSDHPYPLLPGDKLLLCSDGLSGVLADEDIAATLAASDGEEALAGLVQKAIDLGGPDNITAVLVEHRDEGEGPGDRDRATKDAADKED